MKRILLCALTAVAFSASSFALTAAAVAGDQSAEAAHKERMQHWAADHEVMMDARLGGMKAALKLTREAEGATWHTPSLPGSRRACRRNAEKEWPAGWPGEGRESLGWET